MAFVKVVRTTEIPVGKGRFIDAGTDAIAVFNAGRGRFYAVTALCPHEDGPLADGWLEGDTIVCPWHGFDFDVTTGVCLTSEGLSIGINKTRVIDDALKLP